MEAIIIPKDQFQALLARLEKMQQIVEKLSPERNFIDNAEFARIMGISKRTAQTWRDEKRISFSQVGAKIYYRREDVEQLLLQNLTSAIPKEKEQ
jgi:excisionase family DNA binding protein